MWTLWWCMLEVAKCAIRYFRMNNVLCHFLNLGIFGVYIFTTSYALHAPPAQSLRTEPVVISPAHGAEYDFKLPFVIPGAFSQCLSAITTLELWKPCGPASSGTQDLHWDSVLQLTLGYVMTSLPGDSMPWGKKEKKEKDSLFIVLRLCMK